jgi:hypothetical protein
VIIDECEKAAKFKEAWTRAIRATLSDYQGDAWFLSTPKFGKSYFKEIATNSTKFDNWTSWTFTTYDNPYIKKSEVDEARNQLDDLTFRCEYLAEDVDLTSKPYAYCFVKEKHVAKETIPYDENYELMLSFDFNIDPITAIASQYVNDEIRIIKEFRLERSNIYELIEVIKSAYINPLIILTGDATGRNSTALTRGNLNYYKVIKENLGLLESQIKTPSINPAISDGRVLVNSILQHFNVTISPECTYLVDDLLLVEVDEYGKIDKAKDKHRTHLLDCFIYLLNTFHKHLLKTTIFEGTNETNENENYDNPGFHAGGAYISVM